MRNEERDALVRVVGVLERREYRERRAERRERIMRSGAVEPVLPMHRVSPGVVALIPGFWALWVNDDGTPRTVPATHLERDDKRMWLVTCPCGETHEVEVARVVVAACRRGFLGLDDGVAVHRFPADASLATGAEAWAA